MKTVKLTTTGRMTRKAREVTLYAFNDGDRLVIVGSQGGAATNPQWVGNLRAEPRAEVRTGRREEVVCAYEVSDRAERDRLWRLVCEAFPLYETYQRRANRTIPLFVLEPAKVA